MIVVRPRREHQVGLPLADLADDLLAHLQRRKQLAVVIVEDDVFDADALAGLDGFGAPPCRERAAAFGLMAGVAVGDRDEADLVAQRGPFRGRAAGADVAVVRVRAERDDVQRRRGRWLLGVRNGVGAIHQQ